ncbi:methyl jasmonate esterase 1-like isoform X1 [Magnolia sinica]|uniref:methyl jasmonate esterase 1-like isoform X1 n=1 Tax=Magnolia sinica TaxID=86752 RepID=UPI002659C9B1|nr:methyl jasmonate esterase 1-like isoform X1 [Magnolia sinica]
MKEGKNKQHFILVHGACHGAWCWYKVATLLISTGNQVTALDLGSSGTNPKKFNDEFCTFSDYSQPLLDIMASLPPQQKVILVGHSLGGLTLALAMDRYPEKVSAAVFVTAFMPDSSNRLSFVLDKFFESKQYNLMDTKFDFYQGQEELPRMLFGLQYLSQRLYQLSPPEDMTLATTLLRATPLPREEQSNAPILSEERYGSVSRVYIMCDEDICITYNFQRWMIENDPVKEVKVINGSDHMPMFSKPQELCLCLLKIAETYS